MSTDPFRLNIVSIKDDSRSEIRFPAGYDAVDVLNNNAGWCSHSGCGVILGVKPKMPKGSVAMRGPPFPEGFVVDDVTAGWWWDFDVATGKRFCWRHQSDIPPRCARCGHVPELHFDGHSEGAGPCNYLSAPDTYDPTNEVLCKCRAYVAPKEVKP